MNADQVVNLITSWVKKAGALALLFIVAAMLVESAAKLFGIGINFRAPDWSQSTGIVIASLAYALGRA